MQSPADRLSVWRKHRAKDFKSAEELVKEYENIKILDRYIDYYTPKSWPNVFEIVNDGYFCLTGITLIMTAVLIHKRFISADSLEFPVISNNITGTAGAVLKYNNHYYNFMPGKIVTAEYAENNLVHFQTHKVDPKILTSN